MNCREASGLISSAALGGDEGPGGEQLRRHLEACPACRAEFERARAVVLAAEAAKPDMPGELLARVAAASRQEIAVHRSGRRARRLALAAALASAAAALVAAGLFFGRPGPGAAVEDGGWCFVQGDPGNCRQGVLTEGATPDGVAWTRNVPGLPGRLKPLAAGGLIIVSAEPKIRTFRGGGRLVAYRTDSGAVRWEREFPSGDFYKATGFPDRCIHASRLYVTDGRCCRVLDAATGRDLAAIEPPEGAAGWRYLSTEGDRLFGTSGDGRTAFAVDAATGRRLWSRKLDAAAFVPALAGGRLLLHTEDGSLMALAAVDGTELWRTQRAAPTGRASLHARADRGAVLADSGEIAVFSTSDGRTIWRKALSGPTASGLAMSADAIYLQGGNRALALADGFTLWYQEPAASGVCSAPTVVGRELLASPGPERGRLAVMSSSGQVLEVIDRAPAGSCDGAILSRGQIFAVDNGRIVAVHCRPRG
jgi:outer membrane protein assembly factor BamB